MQSIFKYDVDRLNSYAVNIQNNIQIVSEPDYLILSFPQVSYFNYASQLNKKPFTAQQIKNVKDFYRSRQIKKHKVIVNADCTESNTLLSKDPKYNQAASIAKTVLPTASYNTGFENNLKFIKVDNNTIECFTDLYLQGFEADNKDYLNALNNFKTLLAIQDLDLFLLKHNETPVGINVLYKAADENLLAGGAILSQYRNRGFHKSGLNFRINRALAHSASKNIVSWAYKPSISLRNMLLLKMIVQQEFKVYEYCN